MLGKNILGDKSEGEAFTRDLRERGYILALFSQADGERMVRAADAIERLVAFIEAAELPSFGASDMGSPSESGCGPARLEEIRP